MTLAVKTPPSRAVHRRAPEGARARVFISSTFLDLEAERRAIASRAFPELRRRARPYGLDIAEVDLRWGITEAQAAEHGVLALCLAEVDRCRPYFIGLVGSRYGTIIEPHEGKSITELEMERGVFDSPADAHAAYFYVRAPRSSSEAPMSPSEQDAFTRLRERIFACGRPVLDGYSTVDELVEQVIDDLWEQIRVDYSLEAPAEGHARIDSDQSAFATSRARGYVRRPELFDQLDQHVAGAGSPLVVRGRAGVGKSALLVSWVEQRAETRTFLHCTEASSSAASLAQLAERLARFAGLPSSDEPSGPEELIARIPEAFVVLAASGGAVVVLDGLDHLAEEGHATELSWLPASIPNSVRVIVSVAPGDVERELLPRGWRSITVPDLETDRRAKLIDERLVRLGKSLSLEDREALLRSEAAGDPLFLGLALHELHLGSRFERVSEDLRRYLSLSDSSALYEAILARIETGLPDGSDLVGTTCSLLFVARNGLPESELRVLLGHGEPLGSPSWSPIVLGLESGLTDWRGRLRFTHEPIRAAVRRRYLGTSQDVLRARRRLVERLSRCEPDPYVSDELAYQLLELDDREALLDVLCDRSHFEALYRAEDERILFYWRRIDDPAEVASRYRSVVSTWAREHHERDQVAGSLVRLTSCFHEFGLYSEALDLCQRALGIRTESSGADDPRTLEIRHLGAVLLTEQGRWRDAEGELREIAALRSKQPVLDLEGELADISALGRVLHKLGCSCEALEYQRRAVELSSKLYGPNADATSVTRSNLALGLVGLSKLAEAQEILEDNVDRSERTKGRDHPSTLFHLDSLATVLADRGQRRRAEQVHAQVYERRAKVLGPGHPETLATKSNRALVLASFGEHARARRLQEEAVALGREVLGAQHPTTQRMVVNLACSLSDMGHYQEAVEIHAEVLREREHRLGPHHPDTMVARSNLGSTLYDMGELDGAKRSLECLAEVGPGELPRHHPDRLVGLGNLAQVLHERGELEEASRLSEEVWNARREALGDEHPMTVAALTALGCVLMDLGEDERAIDLLGRALETVRGSEQFGELDLATCLDDFAVATSSREPSAALAMHREAWEIRTASLGPRHLDSIISASNVAMSSSELGRHDEAETLMRDTLDLASDLAEDHFVVMTLEHDLGIIIGNAGRWDEAAVQLRRAWEHRREVLGEDHPKTLDSLGNLAELLTREDHEEGEELLYEAAERSARALGSDHPRTILIRRNLAIYLRDVGRYEESERMHRDLLEVLHHVEQGRARALPIQMSLGLVLVALGRLADARELFGAAMEGLRAEHGAEHPDTEAAATILRACAELSEVDAPDWEDALETLREIWV